MGSSVLGRKLFSYQNEGTDMIRKLRKSFIITAMLSVTAVLIVIVAAMNTANFINSDSEADQLLRVLSDNGGSFGQMSSGEQPPEPPSAADGDAPQEKQDGEEPPAKPEGSNVMPESPNGMNERWDRKIFRDGGFGRNFLTAETPYETRFFSVTLKESGDPVTINTGQIASISSDEALTMAQRLFSAGKVTGYEDNFKYLASKTDEGTMYVFIDRTRALRSVWDFMRISLLVGAGAAAAVFVLVFIFSKFAVKPIAESYEKQKKFITNAGHELKTPLAVINSCNEVIELEQGESKWTRSIAAQTEKMTRLTQELVALARMDEGSTQLSMEEFSLSETAAEILDPFELMAEQKGIGFSTDIQPDIMYRGDRNMIGRLFSIMADNAVKYTPEGGNILFTLSAKNKRILFSSENTADNISKGAHPELFDRFNRGDASHSGDIPGFGIGLSTAQSIVTAHNGRIEAFSSDGKSLRITVKL